MLMLLCICLYSDELSLEGLQEELEECKNDDVSNSNPITVLNLEKS